MALTISRQFDQFVEFASGDHANGMDTIARAGDAAEKGVKLALDPNGRDDGKLVLQRQNATCRFSLYYDDLGDRIVVKCEREYDLAQLRVRNDQAAMENVNFKPGSKLVAGHSIKIPAAELDRLADLDFSAYDDAPVQQRLDDPNAEKPYQNIKRHLGEGFGFKNGVTVETSFKLTVN